MSILLADHPDPYNQKLTLELIKRKLSISAVVSDNLDFFAGKKLPKTLKIFDIYDFYYQDRILKLNQNNVRTLSASEIKEYFELESLFLKISDRLSFWPISVRVRLDLYYELLLFWLTFFEQNKITLVLFSQTPHTGYDNIIYYIAKKKGIKTLIGTPTLVNDRILLRTDYDVTTKVPTAFQRDATRESIIKKIDPTLYQDVFGNSTWLSITRDINTRVLKNNQGNVVTRTMTRLVWHWLTQPKQSWQQLFKKTKNSGFVFIGNFITLAEFFITVLSYFPKKDLANYYESLTTSADLSNKYVLFGLHYQPERTTMPEGDIFEHQYLAIKILSQALPKHWLLYVKEHPRQFSLNDVRTNNFRDRTYYDRLKKIRNVRLVPVATNSQELIRKAQFTASIQGTIGWEGLLIGKPTLVFANAWYAACHSCFRVNSFETCQQGISSLRKKTTRQVELDLLKFLAYTQAQFITSAFYHQSAQESSKNYNELLTNLANYVEKFFLESSPKRA